MMLVREDRPVWNPYDEGEGPVGTESVWVVSDGDDSYEFTDPGEAHRAMDAMVEAAAAGRPVWPCSWTVYRPVPEPDFPGDNYGPCGAPSFEDADGNGWHCSAGHAHRSDAEYYDADEAASYTSRGLPLAPNARLMDGSPIR